MHRKWNVYPLVHPLTLVWVLPCIAVCESQYMSVCVLKVKLHFWEAFLTQPPLTVQFWGPLIHHSLCSTSTDALIERASCCGALVQVSFRGKSHHSPGFGVGNAPRVPNGAASNNPKVRETSGWQSHGSVCMGSLDTTISTERPSPLQPP